MDQNTQNPSWNPTTLEMMQAMVVALADTLPPRLDFLFIHGAPVRDDELDEGLVAKAVDLYRTGRVARVALNGLTAETCLQKNLAYGGFERMKELLLKSDVVEGDIVVLAPSGHTGAEARTFLKYAKENGFERIGIMSLQTYKA